MFNKIYKNLIIEKPKFTLSILIILLLSFGYFTKDFQLDASSDTLLLENDPDLKYLREVNKKYGSKDFLVLTYTHKPSDSYNFKSENTIKNLTLLKNSLENLKWVDRVITILDVPLLKNNDDSLAERIKNFKRFAIVQLLPFLFFHVYAFETILQTRWEIHMKQKTISPIHASTG